jgi:membrane-associated phospholipid phosphatase
LPDSPADAGSRRLAARLLAAGALVLALLALAAVSVDMPLARLVHAADWPGDLERLVRLSEVFGYGGTVIVIIVIACALDPRGWRVAPRLVISALGAGVMADLVKLLVFVRTRPEVSDLNASAGDTFVSWFPPGAGERLRELNLEYGAELQSFPSAHTATAVGLAIGLSWLYPRGWWLFAALSAMAGWQRIHSESHFLSDVLAGAAIGLLVGACCTSATGLGRWLARIELRT